MANRDKELTIIIGCGRLGSSLANKLSAENKDVIIIDRNVDSFKKLSGSFGGMSIVGDGCEIDTLIEAQIKKANTVVALTEFDNNNILIAQLVRDMFDCENVVIKLNDKSKKILIEGLDVQTLCPYELSSDNLFNMITIGE